MTHPGIEMIRSLLGESRHLELTIAERRQGLVDITNSPPAPPGISVEPITLARRPAERLTPEGANPGWTVLYLHGGGYCCGSPDTHRGVAGALGIATAATVVTLDYSLGPEEPFPAAVEDAVRAVEELTEQGQRVALAGDSAGGGLSVATAVALRERQGPRPVALAVFSPWADLSQSAASMATKADVDPMLTEAALDQYAAAYLAGADDRDPLASPLYADLAGLPPLLVQVGTDEVLLDDSTSLAAVAADAGVAVTLRVWPEMVHVFQAFPPEIVPEATEALDAAGAFLARHFAGA